MATSSDPFEGIDMSGFRNKREPALIKAARAFQESTSTRYSKMKSDREINIALEKELTQLKKQMDSKMSELQDLQNLAEQTKPAAHILETVMGELEQRNLELSSLLKASEESRKDMEELLKEQNEELTTLRANTLIMQTLEAEVTQLNNKKTELFGVIQTLEEDVASHQSQDQTFNNRLNEMERTHKLEENQWTEYIRDLTMKVVNAEEQLRNKDDELEKTELTIKELFEKCHQLGGSNGDIKNELIHCLESGKKLKDLNTKLQFCKDYLEQQVDELIKELKASKALNEQMRLEMSNMNREKRNSEKQCLLTQEQYSHVRSELEVVKENLSNTQKHLQDYESGNLRSASAMSEISKEKEAHETTKQTLEKQIRELESHAKLQDEELKNALLLGRKMKTDLVQLQSKIEYYQEHFIEKQELQKIKSDLEIKYKLDLNTQLQKVSAMFEQEQNELITTMRTSRAYRQDNELEPSNSPLRATYRTYN
ncbi:putative leucine-rich repeat-containing protein DDB_G0290503 [Hydractinia symbiolongicarpus]|uniref:putative leucine-rich repeat-containing protein DDB_G0290503 n=1 Tax=Hydractinia symbiolongicarpus TaxID=13093 RepID=UPI0025511581|nr:putative leucine-rich repeat-containing protein DDB_G0290503 [Hydractinia symbiolongicarpus]